MIRSGVVAAVSVVTAALTAVVQSVPSIPPAPADAGTALFRVIEYAGKIAVSLAAVWAFFALVGKPLYEWRKRRSSEVIRDVLSKELACLAEIPNIQGQIDRVLARQDEIFNDLDLFLGIASENSDRHDEVNVILTGLGVEFDRRKDGDRRERIADKLDLLRDRRRDRRRRGDKPPNGGQTGAGRAD